MQKKLFLGLRIALSLAAMLPTTTCAGLLVTERITAGPLQVTAEPVALSPSQPQRETVGALTYRGGLELHGDGTGLGGLSAIALDEDGAGFLALSDVGYWIRGRLEFDAARTLVGVSPLYAGALHDANALPVVHPFSDAEALAIADDGTAIIGFERDHRLWSYDRNADGGLSGSPSAVSAPPGLVDAPENGGIEALTLLQDGRWVAVAEELGTEQGQLGWVGTGPPQAIAWQPFRYRAADGFAVSDVAALPDGDLVFLERSFSLLTGFRARLVHVRSSALSAGATVEGETLGAWAPPLTTDNFEAVGVIAGPPNKLMFIIVSDDNFRPFQRNLVLAFEWSAQ